MSNKGTNWQIPLVVSLVYALTIALMILLAPLQLYHRLLGNSVDTWVFYWNDWWLERAIAEDRDWLFTPYLFYPQGVSLVAYSSSFLNSLLALPLRPVVGPVAAYNAVLLLGLWISAMAMFSLVYELTHHASAALLAGFVFALAPYQLTQVLGYGNLGSIHWWPFFALFLRCTLHRQRIMDTLYAGLFAALALWTGLQLAVMLVRGQRSTLVGTFYTEQSHALNADDYGPVLSEASG